MSYVNFVPLGIDHLLSCAPGSLFIPKKLWLRAENRFMTFREIISSGAEKFFKNEQYEQLGIEVLENTPEEITGLVIEMDERLNGTWQATKEDEAFQERFWSVFKPRGFNKNFKLRIGAKFLRKNRELLN